MVKGKLFILAIARINLGANLRYLAGIAAIALVADISVPLNAYAQQTPPSEVRIENQFQSLTEANNKMQSVFGAQKQKKSYGDRFEVSDTLFGTQYSDFVFVPSFERGTDNHRISTYLIDNNSGIIRYSIFVDRLNIQGNGKIPTDLSVFDLPFNQYTGHAGHKTIDSLPFSLSLPASSLLAAMWNVVEHMSYRKWGANVPPEREDDKLEALVRRMEAEMKNLWEFVPSYAKPTPTS